MIKTRNALPHVIKTISRPSKESVIPECFYRESRRNCDPSINAGSWWV